MALYDNKYWLLSHIRNSFISTDDTGMCELVMSGESRDIQTHLKSMEPYPDPESSEDDEDDFESFDLQMDMDFNIRERSNTAAQIEKLQLARKKAAKMRHIKWETHQDSQPDFENLFVKKDVSQINKPEIKQSKLSALIESHADTPKNPFIEYAKFDGTGQVNIPTKCYKIYLTMLPPHQRNYPMPVCCVSSARVQDLIGLILLKFSYNHGIANLKDPNHYGLYITEEDGEVDSDFPCLEPKEPISKFGFTCLGLVEHKEGFKSVSFPEDSNTLITIEELNTRLRTTSETKKADEIKQMENDIQAVEDHNKLMEAPLYRSFRAFMISKVKPKLEVNIGVSGERIEIDPVPQKSSKLLAFKAKAISHPIDSIANCEVTETRANRTCFRIVYGTNLASSPSGTADGSFSGAAGIPQSSSTTYKHYDFEGNHIAANDLVQKIKLILELKSSATREEYLATREKKLQKRRVFTLLTSGL